ncbi:MAG: hypothetical protein ACLQGP_07955 [Isosphaeraceae bacterium]
MAYVEARSFPILSVLLVCESMGATMKPDEFSPRISPPRTSQSSSRGEGGTGPSGEGTSHDPTGSGERFGEALHSDMGEAFLPEPTADQLIQAALEQEAQKRLWLRAIIPLLQLRSHDPDPSGRVQLAFDLMHIAACERASRLLRSDLSSGGDPDRQVVVE